MKPDDLFNAIGDTNDRFIKRARKVYLSAFLFMLVFMINVCFVIFFQIVVIYPYSGEITKGSMQNHPWFTDYKIIDLRPEQDGIHGNRTPTYVLYETETGEHNIVQIVLHEFFPKYQIVKESITPIPSGDQLKLINIKNFLGYNTLNIENNTRITGVSSHGLTRNQDTDFFSLLFTALFLHFIEHLLKSSLRYILRKGRFH